LANNSSGPAVIIAALILGMSMLGAAFVMQLALDNSALKVAETLSAIAESTAELAKAAPAAAPAPSRAAARGGRPDPSKVYQIAVGDSPTQGPKNAAITIVEWSDFQ
jgi:protein-disulfide isomerase